MEKAKRGRFAYGISRTFLTLRTIFVIGVLARQRADPVDDRFGDFPRTIEKFLAPVENRILFRPGRPVLKRTSRSAMSFRIHCRNRLLGIGLIADSPNRVPADSLIVEERHSVDVQAANGMPDWGKTENELEIPAAS
jgi:hypothetical protein